MNDVKIIIAIAVVILIGIQIIQLNSYLRKRAKKIAYGFFAVIFGIVFASLHYYVYLDNSDNNGLSYYLLSYADSPIYLDTLELKKTYKPSYLNPFGRLEYQYSEVGSDEIVIIEAKPLFLSEIQPILGDPIPYWEVENEKYGHIFMRDFVGLEYAGGKFFVVQYLLLASIIFLIRRVIRKEGERAKAKTKKKR